MGVGISIPLQLGTRAEASRPAACGAGDACAPDTPAACGSAATKAPDGLPRASAASTCSSDCSLATTSTSIGSSSLDDSALGGGGGSSSGSDDGALLQLSPQQPSAVTAARSAAPSPYAEGAARCDRTVPFGLQPWPSCSSAAVACEPPLAAAAAAGQERASISSNPNSSSSPLSAATAAPALSLPDLMDSLWSGAPLAAVGAEEAGSDNSSSSGNSKRKDGSCDIGSEPPPGLRNPKLLMPPPTRGATPAFPLAQSAKPVLYPLQTLLRTSQAKKVFNSGTFLGRGGEGEVRRVTLDGTDYALKQSDSAPREVSLAHYCCDSPWLQMPLAVACGDRVSARSCCTYSLFHLATGSLTDVLPGLWGRACGGPTLPEFRAVAAESLTALGQVHAAGLYHADIKPDNFLIAKDGHLCLADFGCAYEAWEDPVGSGTPGFGAPEQDPSGELPQWRLKLRELRQSLGACFGRRYDFRGIDVWGLAVTWLSLLCPDFEEVEKVLAAAASWRRGPPRRWRPPAWVPAEVAHLIFHCMLVRRPGARVSVRRLQRHAFFAGVDWAAVEARAASLPLDLGALAVDGQQYWKQQRQQEEQLHAAAVLAGP
ncbi:serine threonine kinase [Raphidocelis subcapitata]|uniref:non-specific serine/threonine protein kinase n=1 Tax=Raphidocelis subcapitata TaxID=307507 RepID=A0A2V0NWL5_9CHLO|nr:serine threonine kinase [Raphidocelis subcapitata]|eukprot:GBF89205.1 serine threonine kinase [Raphidocelis subcapitata]